jgi:tetratricopeptide (TPR) repeat protein
MNEFNFARFDVWLVHLACAVPLAMSLIRLLIRRPLAFNPTAGMLPAAAFLALVVPWIYREARWRHDLRQLQSLLEQSRFGEAQPLAAMLLRLDEDAVLGEVTLRDLSADIDRTVLNLEMRSSEPLATGARVADRLARARDLAMLGKTGDALSVLAEAAAEGDSPQAANLCGTIYETRHQWRPARDWYSRAKAAWEREPQSPERTAGVVQAATGIGFAERKLGRYREAEAAYQQVLALSPSADSHFLLARFYEDTQQAAQAQAHARAATALDPQRYQQPAGALIDKLVTYHFGCWGVRSAELRAGSLSR